MEPGPHTQEPEALRENTAWRVLTTPLPLPFSVRGWLASNREDWKAVVRGSGLPAPLQQTVALIVRRTRLWRSEKAEVARELCAHFTDGVEVGRKPEDLSRDFGDPRDVARLIRKAKKRGRPLWWRTWRIGVRAVGCTVLVLIAAYLVMALMFFAVKPSIKRNYAAEINAPILAVPEAQRAWPVFFEAMKKVGRVPEALTKAQLDEKGTPLTNGDSWPQKPGDIRWPEARAWVTSKHEGVGLVRRAAAMEHLGYPLLDRVPEDYQRWQYEGSGQTPGSQPPSEDNPPLIGLLIPYLGEFRAMARLLTADARIAAESQDADRFVADIRAMCGLARQCDELHTFINKLVQIAILALAQDTVKDALSRDFLHPPHLRDLAHTFAAFDDSVLHAPLGLERTFLLDFVQRTYSDDGHGGGHMTYEGLKQLESFTSAADLTFGPPQREVLTIAAGPLSIAGMASRTELLTEAERLYAMSEREAATPQWEREGSEADVEVAKLSESVVSRSRYFLLVTLMPAIGKVHVTIDQARQTRDGVLAAIAVETYRREHGEYPPSLDVLVPGLLPAMPLDSYDGKPLKYRLVGDGSAARPVIYSVGVDRTDDGGRGPKDPRNASNMFSFKQRGTVQRLLADAATHDAFSGDWILYEPK